MGYHPLLDECLKGAQRVIKAQGDIKFEGMLYRKHRLKVPESVVRGYEELLKYELFLSLRRSASRHFPHSKAYFTN